MNIAIKFIEKSYEVALVYTETVLISSLVRKH